MMLYVEIAAGYDLPPARWLRSAGFLRISVSKRIPLVKAVL
jgi:hypothetical protein